MGNTGEAHKHRCRLTGSAAHTLAESPCCTPDATLSTTLQLKEDTKKGEGNITNKYNLQSWMKPGTRGEKVSGSEEHLVNYE